MRPSFRRRGGALTGRDLLQPAALAYLILLPLGSLVVVPVGGAAATLADGFLGGLLAVGAVAGLHALLARRREGGDAELPTGRARWPGGPAALALLLLLGFGAWVAAGALWSPRPAYALAKGAGYTALALGAACVAWSGLRWGAALDGWLAGTALALAVTVTLVTLAPESWAQRVVERGGPVEGLPFGRLSGPFGDPARFGDYLVVSGAALWARWPALTLRSAGTAAGPAKGPGPAWRRGLAVVGAVALALALALTVSTAWLAAGVLLVLWGRRLASLRARGATRVRTVVSSVLLRGAGAAAAAAAMAGLMFSLRIEVAGLRVVTSGLRSEIWSRALRPFLEFPLRGVGALPHLARTTDPLEPSAAGRLWDAGNVYISVLGQFGAVGFVLLAGALWLLVRAVRRPRRPDGEPDLTVVRGGGDEVLPGPVMRDRVRTGVLAALLAIGIHGVAVAGEDFRHWWALLGLAALGAVADRRAHARAGPGPGRDAPVGEERPA